MPPDRAEDLLVRPRFLTPDEQRNVVRTVLSMEPGFYVPKTRWGQSMSLRMNCLGHHWSARDYKYHPVRKDVDGEPCPPLPDDLQALARRAIVETGYLSPADHRPFDVCVVNLYPEGVGKLGDHVDNSESPAALSSGYPVVSLSVGASCVFRIGGTARTDPYETFTLDSGDLVIFGRTKRLAHHGVRKTIPGTTPPDLGLPEPGRINLTFRIL